MSQWTSLVPWGISAVVALALVGAGVLVRIAVKLDAMQRARVRESLAGLAQYGLLFGFAAVAAAVSAHGLIGFARTDMELRGPWPYLLWGALDGAAALCAVLLMRRAARGESALAPRLAVWGLVAASSVFNWTHAPDRPGARGAFALMPVIAAMLFEFSLRETRHVAGRADRRLGDWRWLRPVEWVQVKLLLATDGGLTVQDATRRVQTDRAARRLHQLRGSLGSQNASAASDSRRARRAERRAQAALVRARFTDPDVAAAVLRQARMLALTVALATLDTGSSHLAGTDLAELITTQTGGGSPLRLSATPTTDPSATQVQADDGTLLDAASRIVSEARQHGVHLSQAELARRLRAGGLTIANGRLRSLASAVGLDTCQGPL